MVQGRTLHTLDVLSAGVFCWCRMCFTSYNKLLCCSRRSLSDEYVKVLHSAAHSGEICG